MEKNEEALFPTIPPQTPREMLEGVLAAGDADAGAIATLVIERGDGTAAVYGGFASSLEDEGPAILRRHADLMRETAAQMEEGGGHEQ